MFPSLYTRLLSSPWFPYIMSALITYVGRGRELQQGSAFSEDELLVHYFD